MRTTATANALSLSRRGTAPESDSSKPLSYPMLVEKVLKTVQVKAMAGRNVRAVSDGSLDLEVATVEEVRGSKRRGPLQIGASA